MCFSRVKRKDGEITGLAAQVTRGTFVLSLPGPFSAHRSQYIDQSRRRSTGQFFGKTDIREKARAS